MPEDPRLGIMARVIERYPSADPHPEDLAEAILDALKSEVRCSSCADPALVRRYEELSEAWGRELLRRREEEGDAA